MLHIYSHRKIPDWGHVVWEVNYMLVILQRARGVLHREITKNLVLTKQGFNKK